MKGLGAKYYDVYYPDKEIEKHVIMCDIKAGTLQRELS